MIHKINHWIKFISYLITLSCIASIVSKTILIILIVFQKTTNIIAMVLNLSRQLAQQSIRNFTHTTWISGEYSNHSSVVIVNDIPFFRSSSHPDPFCWEGCSRCPDHDWDPCWPYVHPDTDWELQEERLNIFLFKTLPGRSLNVIKCLTEQSFDLKMKAFFWLTKLGWSWKNVRLE